MSPGNAPASADRRDDHGNGSKRDSDGDGLPDAVERATGTDPLKTDTDADGVADGREDANRDGVVNAGESNPRLAGLFPGSFPHIPEPMVFDLVRAVGARAGELEVNTLAVFVPRGGHLRAAWAPEVEYAFADRHAIEIELPMIDRELHALKVAVQGTLPDLAPRFIHGWQLIAEMHLEHPAADLTLLYLAGHRFARSWSAFAMAGARMSVGEAGTASPQIVVNPSLFFDALESVTVGLETNAFVPVDGHHPWELRLIPQVHLQLTKRVRIQLGAGADIVDSHVSSLWATRVILE